MNQKKLKKLRKEFRNRGVNPLVKEDFIDEEGVIWNNMYYKMYKIARDNLSKAKI